MSIRDAVADVKAISHCVGNLNVDVSATVDTSIDEDRIAWYRERFQLFIDDGVPSALSAYLNHLLREDISDLTKSMIIQMSLEMQNIK